MCVTKSASRFKHIDAVAQSNIKLPLLGFIGARCQNRLQASRQDALPGGVNGIHGIEHFLTNSKRTRIFRGHTLHTLQHRAPQLAHTRFVADGDLGTGGHRVLIRVANIAKTVGESAASTEHLVRVIDRKEWQGPIACNFNVRGINRQLQLQLQHFHAIAHRAISKDIGVKLQAKWIRLRCRNQCTSVGHGHIRVIHDALQISLAIP